MKEQISIAFTKISYFVNNEAIPYMNTIITETIKLVKGVQQVQKEFDFITNFIFIFIVLVILYNALKVLFYIRRKVLRITENIVFSCKKGLWRKKITTVKKQVETNLTPTNKNMKYKTLFEFKDEPIKVEEILRELNRARDKDPQNVDIPLEKLNGKLFNVDEKQMKSISYQAALNYSYSNLLHPDVFVSSRNFEAELIKNLLSFFGGNLKDSCGVTTYNSSESLILVSLAYMHLTKKPDPEILVSEACSSLYFRVAQMVNVKLRLLPVDDEGKVLVDSLKTIIKKHKNNIICVIGLYPNNAFGSADDIEAMAKICLDQKIHFHVDASFGAFQAAFSRDSTLYKKFDFSLPGVSSLSANLSAFAKCPTGICFVGYRNREIRKNHYFLFGKWMGGMYASPTLPGSRVGSIVVTAFVTLLNLGLGKYKVTSQKNYKLITKLKKDITDGISQIKVVGDPIFNVISLTSDLLNIASIYECLKRDLKWELALRFGNNKKVDSKSKTAGLQNALQKDSISLTITNNNYDSVESNFITDLKTAVQLVEKSPESYKESATTSTLREISKMPVEVQNEVLAEFVSSKCEFKK